MNIEAKKGSDSAGGISILNQLTMTLQEAALKLEQAFKKNNPEQVKVLKEFILKVQRRIAEELS
jgi:hypothetical protein